MRDISARASRNTSAIYGFTNTLLELLTKQAPTHLAVVFDTHAPTARHVEFPAYKAQRQEMPEELSAAIPDVKRLIRAFNLPVLELDGYEADDIIGTLAREAYEGAPLPREQHAVAVVAVDAVRARAARRSVAPLVAQRSGDVHVPRWADCGIGRSACRRGRSGEAKGWGALFLVHKVTLCVGSGDSQTIGSHVFTLNNFFRHGA